jgi:hypothetical protein
MNRLSMKHRYFAVLTGSIVVTGAFAQIAVPRSAPARIPGVAPTGPRSVSSSVIPPGAVGPVVPPAMPRSPVGNGLLPVNKRQSLVPALDIVRPTPAVAMVVARDMKQHAEFQESRLIAVVQRPVVAPSALPLTLGISGPTLKKGQTVIVENDGRKVSSGEYAQDTSMVEAYLNSRGTTQRKRENVHKLRNMRRQIAASRLPPADSNTLRPTSTAKQAQTPSDMSNLRVLPATRARTVAEARAGLWESGETVTLDRYKSKDEASHHR